MPSYKQQNLSREKAGNLRPLTSRQVTWLREQAALAAVDPDHGFRGRRQFEPWWIPYFSLPAAAWLDPYIISDARTMPKTQWATFRARVTEDLESARNDKQVWMELIQAGRLPPENRQNYVHVHHSGKRRGTQHASISRKTAVVGDPYALPEYFDWWQGEYAFRRGFRDHLEGLTDLTENLRSTIKSAIQAGGGQSITANKMLSVARSVGQDPALTHFFTEYANELSAGTAKQFGKLTDLISTALRYRTFAYEAFSPDYLPLRGGGAFFGLSGTRKRRYRRR